MVKAVQTLIHSKQDAKVITKSLSVLITVCQWLLCLLGADLITINSERIMEVELKVGMERANDTFNMKAKET